MNEENKDSMQYDLEGIQIMMKDIARRALKVENLIDEEVHKGQWGSAETYKVEEEMRQINIARDVCKKCLDKVKMAQDC